MKHKDLIKAYNVSCSSLNLDLREKNNIDTLVEETISNYGKVDLVFNNAGVVTASPFLEMKESDWDWCNDLNYNSLVYCSRAFLPHLMKEKESALVNTSSIFGIITTPNNTVYHATKFAVRGFTESLAMEMADTNPNLQIHCVHPGHIGTNIAADARMDDQDFNEDEEGVSRSIFTRNAPKFQKKWAICSKKVECTQVKLPKLF